MGLFDKKKPVNQSTTNNVNVGSMAGVNNYNDSNLVLKFSDFGLLRNPKEIEDEFENVKIPGGTNGYLPPDHYYKKGIVSYKESIKYDFFALGATIFYIKF